MADYYTNYLVHHGIKGQKWGVRRYRNADGTLTAEGRKKYGKGANDKRQYARAKTAKNVAITGAAIVGTTLAAYGGYKLYKAANSHSVNIGKQTIQKVRARRVNPNSYMYEWIPKKVKLATDVEYRTL